MDDSERISVRPDRQAQLAPVLRAYHKSHHGPNPTICSLEFVTVNDYLWLLKELAVIVQPLGKRAMFYLAAAVSDFFLPQSRIVSRVAGVFEGQADWRAGGA
jgi:phosphopantothenate-cysteine ligase